MKHIQQFFTFLAISASILVSSLAPAKTVTLTDAHERTEMIRNATVWERPDWISPDYAFSPDLDVLKGPKAKDNDKLLEEDTVFCQVTADDLEFNGKTPKFECTLMEIKKDETTPSFVVNAKGKLDNIKVKYSKEEKPNDEVWAEMIGTRLFWALGFGADRMFYVNKTVCFGCSEDPFKKRKIDPDSLITPREFSPTAIERKMPGTEIEFKNPPHSNRPSLPPQPDLAPAKGWKFGELMRVLPKDPALAREEKIHRDALRLLSVLIQHVDSKAENQRIICTDKDYEEGKKCQSSRLIVQDLGATFGMGVDFGKLRIDKFNLDAWKQKELWKKNTKDCKASLGLNGDSTLSQPEISEEGRQFLLKLLLGFTAGPEGRKRVEDLFHGAHVERRGYTAEAWADAFMDKVQQVQFPMGEQNSNARCKSIDKK